MSVFGAMMLAASSTAFGLGPQWQPVADPLAEARAGKIYCNKPDHVAKTCVGAVFFRFGKEGEVVSVLTIPINNEPDLTIVMPVRAWVEDGALCTRPGPVDVDRMRLLMGAEPYDKPAGKKLLGRLKAEYAKIFIGMKMCEHIFADGDRLFSVGLIDGVHRPGLDSEIEWFDPDGLYDLRATENLLEE